MRTLQTLVLVARHEVRQAWRTRTLATFAVVATLLLAVAATFSAARLADDAGARERYRALVDAQWRDQPDRHPHRVAHYGTLVFRPVAPLGIFDPGVERFTGTSLFLEAHRANFANFTDATESDALLRVGDLSPAMVVQMILPLFIVVVAAVSVTREREQGSLPLLRCQGASWPAILAGKLAGTCLTAVLATLPGVALTAGILVLAGGFDGWAWTPDLATRVTSLAAAHGIYLVLLAGLAVVLAATQQTTRGALVVVLSVWIVVMVVVPRIVPAMATAFYPVPARTLFAAEVERHIRRLGDGHNPNDPRFQAFRAATLAAHGVARVEDLPINYNGLVSAEAERLTTQANREELARVHDVYAHQQRVVAVGSLLSPYLAMRSISMALSGVDGRQAAAFEQQAEEHRFELVQYLNGLHANEVAHALDRYVESSGETLAPSRQRIDREHWAQAPAFAPRTLPMRDAIGSSALPAGGLVLWTLGLLAAVVTSARWSRVW